jgi:dolichyl-phosphate-mannose-protein mannosyltransferase
MKEKTKAKKRSFFIPNIVYVLVIGLIARIIFSGIGTLRLDQGTFIGWSSILIRDGFKAFYNSWSDYLPGYLYILYFLGRIRDFIPDVLLYKLPAMLTDLATGYLIYRILKESKGSRWGLIGAGIYLFNPAILANSSLWGQVDSLTALTSMLSIYLMPTSFVLSAVSLAVGTLIKPQTAFVFPVIIFMMFREKWKVQKIFAYTLIGLTVFVGLFIPFWGHGNLVSFIYERLGISLNQYPYTSINAFNFWGLTGFWKADNIFYQIAGYGLVLISTSLAAIKLWKIKNAPYYLSAFIFAASFMFFTRMHERHLLPVFAPLAIIAVENPIFLIPYLGFSVTYLANLYYAYVWISDNFKEIFSGFVIKLFEIINGSLILFIFYLFMRGLKVEWGKILLTMNRFINSWKKRKIQTVQVKLPKISLSPQRAKLILILILLFAFVTRTFDLWSPKAEYFDEVYHAFTARVILHEDPKAWEWWNIPPEGFAYEWTHPPLAKLMMVFSMRIFGVKTTQIEEDSITKFNYTVLGGENLWNLARKTYGNGMRFTDIAKQNNLSDPRKIYPNQILILEKLEKHIKTETIFPGENSFGWRIPGALLGVGSVFLVYFLAKELFKDEATGLLAAAVFSLDGLALVMSRIGMNDSYMLFFALLSIYLFLKQKDLPSAISFGLAMASKWSALWVVPILFVLWLRRKKRFSLPTFIYFIFLPFVIYLLTYLPMFLTGHNLSIWWGMQKQMWWYHTGLRATHPYSSSWWEWPLLIRPIYLYTSNEVGGFVARIYAMGNPLVFWFGLASVVLSFIYSYVEKNKNLAFVVFSYLIFFVPWAVSPRIMFLYHYLPSIPFLAIATGYILRRNPKLMFGTLLVFLLAFIYFYPHWAGLQIPLWLDKSYYWFPSWR